MALIYLTVLKSQWQIVLTVYDCKLRFWSRNIGKLYVTVTLDRPQMRTMSNFTSFTFADFEVKYFIGSVKAGSLHRMLSYSSSERLKHFGFAKSSVLIDYSFMT